jgi:WD40 repeat protein
LGVEPNPCSGQPFNSVYCNFSLVQSLKGHSSVSALAISSDGKTLISGGNDKALKVWDLSTGKLKQTLQSPSGKISAVAISPDGKTVVSGSGDRMVRIWDLAMGKQKAMLKGHSDTVTAVAIRPDGKTLVSASWDGVFMIWDLATGTLQATYDFLPESEIVLGPLTIEGGTNGRFLLALSANGNTALLRDGDKAITRNLITGQLQAETGETEFQFLPSNILSGNLSPDGKIAVIQYKTYKHGGRIKVWDTATGKPISDHSFNYFTNDGLSAMPIVLDEQRIFGLNFDRRTLLVWNLKTQKMDAAVEIGSVGSLVLSPDSKTLASTVSIGSNKDTQINVWRNP